MIEALTLTGWIIAVASSILAYYYYRQNRRTHQIQLEYMKAAQAVEDDWKRTGQRRGIIKWHENGLPYVAWYIGSEPPPQEHQLELNRTYQTSNDLDATIKHRTKARL